MVIREFLLFKIISSFAVQNIVILEMRRLSKAQKVRSATTLCNG